MNLASWIILGILVLVVLLVLVYLIKNRKKGCCGCSNDSCLYKNKKECKKKDLLWMKMLLF